MNSVHAPVPGVLSDSPDASVANASDAGISTTGVSLPQRTPVCRPPKTDSKARKLNKLALLHHMQLRQIAMATVEYEGGGDEGETIRVELVTVGLDGQNPQIDPPGEATVLVPFWMQDIERTRRRGKLTFKLARIPFNLALDETAWALATDLHGGFYNGDGGNGEVRFHMATQTVLVAHNDHYIASKYSETLV